MSDDEGKQLRRGDLVVYHFPWQLYPHGDMRYTSYSLSRDGCTYMVDSTDDGGGFLCVHMVEGSRFGCAVLERVDGGPIMFEQGMRELKGK